MKTKFITLVLFVISFSLQAQTYTVAYHATPEMDRSKSYYNSLSDFTGKIIEKENFHYREFLRASKRSEKTYKIGNEIMTGRELTKLLRKSARKSGNSTDFRKLLENENPSFKNYLSDKDFQLLYKKFRKGTFNKYVQNLADNWKD
ncbi:hypothetical protein [Gramella sp. MAR_2010_147]|uniref:hypothetical protein n=1 Tax=Gramella sp. MAR_2010_147 TaxID=1250205 RepID=UPI00087CFED6|nr:hypothetical protein [Gramella sp. MAR_2010_147]SDR93550.1 hypothetical protein SAMN04488553_1072 [Gramella sp. MAR_2010_147]